EKYFFPPMNEKKDTYTVRKNSVWGEVWSTQSDIPMDWPFNDKSLELRELANAPFGTPVKGENETRARQQYRDVIYKDYRDGVRDEFTRLAGPITMDFEHVIGMPPVAENDKYLPSYEEIWLTQELVWVKRELLRVIRNTIDTIGFFQPVT